MQKVFFFTGEEKRTLPRTRAKGHTEVVIDDGVNSGTPIEIKTDGTTLKVTDIADNDEEKEYVFLCNEFGLTHSNFKSEISVIYLDGGLMLITLHKGAIILNVNDNFVMPTVGVDSVPKVDNNKIEWVDAEHLSQFLKYEEDWTKARYYQDYEYFIEVSSAGKGNFSYRAISEKDKDISLGQMGVLIQQKKNREEALKAKKQLNAIFNANKGNDSFDEDEEDEEEDDIWDDDLD